MQMDRSNSLPRHGRVLLALPVLALALACGGGGGDVNSARTVSGTRIFTYLPFDAAAGTVAEDPIPATPSDPAAYVSALLADGTSIAGSYAPATGAFTIPQVPDGYYWLKVERGDHDHYIWTNKDSVDLGTKIGGRSDVEYASTSPTNLVFNTASLGSWNSGGDYLQFVDINSNLYSEPDYEADSGSPVQDDIALSGLTVDWARWSYPLLDTTKGDAPRLIQMVYTNLGPISARIAKRVYAPTSLQMTNGNSATIGGSFSLDPLASTVTVNFDGTAFRTYNSPINPSATRSDPYMNFWDGPGFAAHGDQGSSECVLRTDGTTDHVNAGSVNVPALRTGFERLARGYDRHYVDLQLPGTTLFWRYTGGLRAYTTALPTSTSPLSPLVGPVQEPKVNGSSMFGDLSAVGLRPTFSWAAPANGTAQGYALYIYNMYADGSQTLGRQIATLWVGGNHTQIQLPAGLFESGKTYFVCLRSWSEGGFDPESAPYQAWHLPYGYADSLSGLLKP